SRAVRGRRGASGRRGLRTPGRRRSDAEPLGSVYRLRQEPVAIGDALLEAKRRVGLVGIRRLLRDTRPVLRRSVANGIDHLEATRPAARHDDDARPLAGADEHVMRPGWAVDEVPGLQAPLLPFDHEHALAGDDEEVLLAALAVVHAVPLPRHEHVDAEAELGPLLATFEVRVLSTCVAVDPRGLAGVEDEPALALRDEALLGRLHLGFGHRRIVHETTPSTRVT